MEGLIRAIKMLYKRAGGWTQQNFHLTFYYLITYYWNVAGLGGVKCGHYVRRTSGPVSALQNPTDDITDFRSSVYMSADTPKLDVDIYS